MTPVTFCRSDGASTSTVRKPCPSSAVRVRTRKLPVSRVGWPLAIESQPSPPGSRMTVAFAGRSGVSTSVFTVMPGRRLLTTTRSSADAGTAANATAANANDTIRDPAVILASVIDALVREEPHEK